MSVSIDLRKRLSRDVKTFRIKYQRIQHSFVNSSRFFNEREKKTIIEEKKMIEKEENNRDNSKNSLNDEFN
jgi:hypothetical protein